MACDKYNILVLLLIVVTTLIVYINMSTIMERAEPKKFYQLTEEEVLFNANLKLNRIHSDTTTEKPKHVHKVLKIDNEEVRSNPYLKMFYNSHITTKKHRKQKKRNGKFDWEKVLFNSYLKRFNKSYSAEEWNKRFGYFKQSFKEIYLQSSRTGAKHGLTKFSDWSKEEFAKVMNNTRYSEYRCRSINVQCGEKVSSYNGDSFVSYLNKSIPTNFDWRKGGKVIGPVLNQKLCNGCWAFGIVGVMESMAVIQDIEPYKRRSIQELIDCSLETEGCKSGHVTLALHFLCSHNLGVVREDDYPLLLVNEHCDIHRRYEPDNRKIKEFWTYCNMDEEDILRRIAQIGPVIAVINAEPLRNYVEGIIQRSCYRSKDGNSIDHVVQIVGYDLRGDIKYYIVKNSWGTDFGEDGYFRLEIGKNLCGISDEITYFDVY